MMRTFSGQCRRFRLGRASGFTLIELIFVLVIGFIALSAFVVCAVYAIGAYLVANPRPDRVYESGQPHSAIVEPADSDDLARGNLPSDECRLHDGLGSCFTPR
jgi:hypothetical protein